MIKNEATSYAERKYKFLRYLFDLLRKYNIICLSRSGKVVSILTFYSDDPSLNPADAYNFFCKICV